MRITESSRLGKLTDRLTQVLGGRLGRQVQSGLEQRGKQSIQRRRQCADPDRCLRPCSPVPPLRDTASYDRNHSSRQTFYGFRLHVRCDRSGRIEAMSLAGADQSDLALVPEIVPHASAHYWTIATTGHPT